MPEICGIMEESESFW